MWCRHCQQDVSAARNATGPAMCSRCRRSLMAPCDAPTIKLATIIDCGVELEEFDRASCAEAPAARPAIAASDEDLRRLQRMLRPSVRSDYSHARPVLREPAPPIATLPLPANRMETPAATYGQSRTSSSGLNPLLVLGVVTFVVGVGLLVAGNVQMHDAAWRWGLATTMAGEGLLIGGLIALATRLWSNSRRANSQLDLIDRRIGDVQSSVYPVGRLGALSADYLWRFDAGEPLGLDRLAVATR